jgi:hypothetical protein
MLGGHHGCMSIDQQALQASDQGVRHHLVRLCCSKRFKACCTNCTW